jgi:hypothetical protein
VVAAFWLLKLAQSDWKRWRARLVPARPSSWRRRLYAVAPAALVGRRRFGIRRPEATTLARMLLSGDRLSHGLPEPGSLPDDPALWIVAGNRAPPAGVNPSMRHATIWLST